MMVEKAKQEVRLQTNNPKRISPVAAEPENISLYEIRKLTNLFISKVTITIPSAFRVVSRFAHSTVE